MLKFFTKLYCVLFVSVIIMTVCSSPLFAQSYVMLNGTITVNASGGIFYDQGGSAGSYANSLNLTETFCSGVAGKCVSFTFQTFNTEVTSDVLTVYDGSNTSSPVIGTYSGNLGSGVPVISASSGCVTFHFTSNASVTKPGWQAVVNLVPCPIPPTNDDPCSAQSLTATTTCSYSTFSTSYATASAGITAPGCGNYMGGDVWFKVVVPANGIVHVKTQAQDITDGAMALYTGACGTLTLVDCNDNSIGLMPELTETSLTPGTTVYIRFWESGNDVSGNFGICVTNSVCGCISGIPPANDDCSGAFDLGTLPTPAACPTGSGSAITVSGTNVCATASNPYNSAYKCQAGNTQAQPAGDVWYKVVLTGTILTVNITGGLIQPNVAVYTGASCNNLIAKGCAVGDATGLSASFAPLSPGTYWIQVSGGTMTDECDFTMSVYNSVDCSTCVRGSNLTVNPPPVNGYYAPGTTVNFCLNVTDYHQSSSSNDWLHGVVPKFGVGWDQSTLTTTPANTCNGVDGFWKWYSSPITSTGTGITVGPGFFFETKQGSPANVIDNNPGDNYGDDDVNNLCQWTFCWTITTLPPNQCVQGADCSVEVYNYADGQTGSWTTSACAGDPPNVAYAILQCCENPTVTTVTATCGNANGSATALGSGIGPWTYQWYNDASTLLQTANNVNGTNTLNAIPFGNYYVVVTNAFGCMAKSYFNITQSSTIPLVCTATNVDCNGSASGSITLAVNGGTSPYNFQWTNGGNGQNLNSIGVGTYSVTVTDAGGCTGTSSASITQPTALLSSINSSTNVNCNSNSTGAIDLNVSGGTSPYNYTWTNGAVTQDVSNIPAGGYTVTVTDAKGCTAISSVNITQPSSPLSISVASQANVLCKGNANGSIDINVGGGTPSYLYKWSNGSTSQDLNNISGGSYTITVTDTKGCSAVNTVSITEPAILAATPSATNIQCNGAATGSISLNVTGGVTAYHYSWSNSATTQNISSIPAGSYTVLVTDANNCTTSATSAITENTAISISPTTSTATCGNANGSVTLTSVSGGVAGYSYKWSNGATTQNLAAVLAGNFTVTVTDSKGCTQTASASVSNATGPTVSQSSVNVKCAGAATGSANLNISGGAAPYTYKWSNNVTTQNISNLIAGTYLVTVTDHNNCFATSSVTITEPSALQISSLIPANSFCGNANGTVNLTANGGTPAYQYKWSNGATTQDITAVLAGGYSVTLTDANSCSLTSSAAVSNTPGPALSAVPTNATCKNSSTGSVALTVANGTAGFSYHWSDGETTKDAANVAAGTYSITVTDSKGCTATTSALVGEPTALSIAGTPVNSSCGNANAAINSTPSGGTPSYSYLWSNGATTQNNSGILAGTYTITLTDANNCVKTGTFTAGNIAGPFLAANPVNVSCNGGANGSINLIVTGGTSPFTYLWASGATTQNRTGLSAGTYKVTVTDINGCTVNASATITEPTALSLSATGNDVSCFGENTGSISLTATGGTGAYTYSWSNGLTTQNLTNLTIGSYSVTVTDANGCSKATSASINQPFALTASANPVNATCGSSNGTITLTRGGGTSPYSYKWNTGATTKNIINLAPAGYTVTVTDNNGCTTTASAAISNIPGPTVVPSTIKTKCNGDATGEVDLTVSAGTAPFAYLWPDGSTGSSLMNVAVGSYTVTVTDANTCTATATGVVTQPAVLTAGNTPVNVSCKNGSSGSINLTAVGGTSPYYYNWSTGATTQNVSNLAVGSYSATVTDANGCTTASSAALTEPTAITVNSTPTAISCFSGSNGTISINATGGTGAYSYKWSNGPTTKNISGLSAATYTVTVTDVNGCTASLPVIVGQPAAPVSVTLAGELLPLCKGNADGGMDINVAGGTAPYVYNWSNGVTDQNLADVSAGSYTVTTTDAKGCSLSNTFALGEPVLLVANLTPVNVQCNGASTGSISLSVTGGTSGYSYSWSNGTSSQNINGLAAGSYSVTVNDANGCQASTSSTLTQNTAITSGFSSTPATCGNPNGDVNVNVNGGAGGYHYQWSNGASTLNLSNVMSGNYTVTITDADGCTGSLNTSVSNVGGPTLSNTSVNENCKSGNNGSVDLNVSGGISPYTYNWSNGATTQDVTNLSAGNYLVTVTDFNNCNATLGVTITEPSLLQIVTIIPANSFCGNANGSVGLTVSGGTPGYRFNWSDNSTDQNLNNVSAASYQVTVTDVNNCFVTGSATVVNTPGPSLSTTHTDATCNGNATGTITLTRTNGTAPFAYIWSNGRTTKNISTISAGNYIVTVTDGKGCTATTNETVGEPVALSVTGNPVSSTCGNANGGTNINPAGGTLPYTFNWSNGASSQNISNVQAASYDVTVTDANQCTQTGTYTITNITGPTLSVTPTNVSCKGGTNGSIALIINGGTSPYQYNWSNGTTAQDLAGAGAGNYNVTVTDANACTATIAGLVTEPTALSVNVTPTAVSCFGGSNGTVSSAANGGTGAYNYNWSDGSTTQNVSNEIAGNYSVTVTDANGCSVSNNITISQPAAAIAISIVSQSDALCKGDANGSAVISVNGGTPAYSYNWSDGTVQQNLNGAASGSYTVIVTDANGCTLIQSVIIGEPTALAASSSATSALCNGTATGNVNFNASGGTPAYTYQWNNGATTQNLSGVAAGNYTAIVTDANGCTASSTQTVNEPVVLSISGNPVSSTCGNANGMVNTLPAGGTSPYTYTWTNGATDQNISNLIAGNYIVTLTDVNNCIATGIFTVSDIAGPTLSTHKTNVLCNGGTDGAIDLVVTGGTSPYLYNWSNGTSTEDISNIPAGSYSVTVTDANGCTALRSMNVNQPALPVSITLVNNSDVLCNGNSNGSIDISVNGGTLPYTYNWSNGSSSQDLNNIGAGAYIVTVTDSKGCSLFNSFTINEPAVLAAIPSAVNVLCNGASTGSINLNVTGGTAAYSYNWSNGSTIQNISGLPAGSYTVAITDVNGCTASAASTITENSPIVINSLSNPATCGNSNGSVNINVSGGGGAYQYAWNNGVSAKNLTGVPASNYSLTVTDGNGCVGLISASVSNTGGPTITDTSADVKCKGYLTGTVQLTVNGGVSPYQYSWSNGASTQNLANLVAGTYLVTVTDANSCFATKNVVINEPPALQINNISPANSFCGNANGSISLAVSGGTPGYRFNWSNNQTTQNLNNVLPGNYNVIVTDTNSCSVTGTVTVSNTPGPNLSTTHTDATCKGSATGTVTLIVAGGTPGFNYLWSDGETTANIANVNAGNYSVTVTDSKGCSAIATATVAEPAAITVTGTSKNSTCGNANGSITLNVVGGTAPYSFNWSNGGTTKNISGLVAASYMVIVMDANNCGANKTIAVNNTSGPSVSIITHNPVCYGLKNGSVLATVSGGTSPFQYNWSNGIVFANNPGLGTGNYSLTVTDANGCSGTSLATLVQPAQLILTGSGTYAKCGNANGTVTLNANGGILPYLYSWSNGATTQNLSNIISGSYTVTVTDSNSCHSNLSVAIINIFGPVLSQTHVNTTCGNTNGSIDLSLTGGVAPYAYAWNTGATTQDVSNIGAGNYVVNVTDSNSCKSALSVVISNANGPVATETHVNTTCGNTNGSIDLTVTGGVAPYTYHWDNGATTQDLSNINARTYSVIVTDANGCKTFLSATVSDATAPTPQVAYTDETCGSANGAIDLSVAGGLPPYTYMWSNSKTTQDVSGIKAGNYFVTVTDANSCNSILSVNIENIPGPSLYETHTSSTCGIANASVNLIVNGGYTPFTYVWTNGDSTEDLNNVLAGSYAVTVTDGNACTALLSATINNISGPTVSATHTDATCGNSNGTISLIVNGGTLPYTYSWNSGDTTAALSDLTPDEYSVVVSDSNNCQASVWDSVKNVVGPMITETHINATCGNNNSSIDITVIGGTPPFTYNWSDGELTEDLSNLGSGNYSITATDANLCNALLSVTINNTTNPIITATHIDATCGSSNGEIDLAVNAGVAPYTYIWNTPGTTASISNINSGNYNVTVTDVNNCNATLSVTVNNLNGPSVSETHVNTTCGNNNGSIDLTINGGIAPYAYAWMGGDTTEDLDNIAASSYAVTITDANNCNASLSVVVTNTSGPTLAETQTNATCGNGNGAINIIVNGGVPPFVYAWSNGSTTQNLSDLSADDYTVTVTDSNSCYATLLVTISNTNGPSVSETHADATCGKANGSVSLVVNGGVSPYQFLWIDGSTTQNLTNVIAGSYGVTVTDANNCKASLSATIGNTNGPALIDTVINTTCGNSNGAINLTVNGGVSPYSYSWSNNASTQNISAIAANNYGVTVTDANSCIATLSVSVTNANGPTLSENHTNTTCGNSNGSINLIVNGGVAPYAYLWSNSASTQNISGIAADNYGVTVTDADNCSTTLPVIITNTSGPTVTETHTFSFCGNNNGGIILQVNGGVGPYTYSWSNSASTRDLVNLGVGNYAVTVTDANNCTDTLSAAIIAVNGPTLSETHTNATCGNSNGSITLQLSGGLAPFTYSWSNGASTKNLSNLGAGNYGVTVTDLNGCTSSLAVNITNTGGPALSETHTNTTCGNNNGGINLTVNGGVAPYTYLWTGGATTQNLGNMGVGTYDVTVTDANSCNTTLSVAIVNTNGPALSETHANTSCGNSNGSINLTVNGGAAPYTYLWTGGATTQNLTNKGAGTYGVTVTDANNCKATLTATITNTNGPTLSETHVNSTCGNSNASINLTVNGGVAPYTYNWTNGLKTQNLGGIGIGNYGVTVTDANSCSVTLPVSITNTNGPTVTEVHNDATCGNSNGNIALTVSGGVAPYVYLWSNGAKTQNLTGLNTGNYTVTVSDANTCNSTLQVSIANSTLPALTQTLVTPNCGNNNGAISLSVSNGTFPYQYKWSTNATTPSISNLTTGNYNVTVTDKYGCTATSVINLSCIAPPPCLVAVSAATTNISCKGLCNGAINLTVTNAVNPVIYNWSNGSTTENVSSLCAGTYTVLVQDVNGCAKLDTVDVIEPIALQANTAVTNVQCNGSSTGAVDLTVKGGVAPYVYNWSNQMATSNIKNISAGSYSVTVTDKNKCTANASGNVSQPTALAIDTSTTSSSCGLANGSIKVTVNGGTLPYSFYWSNHAISQNINNLSGGNYSLTVTDKNGCNASYIIPVGSSSSPVVNAGPRNQSVCEGQSVVLSASGGGTYLWQPAGSLSSSTGASVTASPASTTTYSVTGNNGNGCVANTVLVVVVNPLPVLSVSSTASSLCGGSKALLTASGGSNYMWMPDNGLSSTKGALVVAGPSVNTTYTVTGTNQFGCTATASTALEVGIYPDIIVNVDPDSGCAPLTVGFKNNTTGAATFHWDFGDRSTSNEVSPVHIYKDPGTYNVMLVATSAGGCVETLPVATIEVLARPTAGFTVSPNGIGVVTVIGNATFTFNNSSQNATSFVWQYGDGSSDTAYDGYHTYVNEGQFNVSLVAFNSEGCSDTMQLGPIVIVPDGEVLIPNVFTPNGDGLNDYFQVYGSGIESYTMEIFDRIGEHLFTSDATNPAWDGTFKGKPMNTGVFVYVINIHFMNGKSTRRAGDVTLLR